MTCTGECCAAFTLSEEAQWLLRHREGTANPQRHVPDGDMIDAMKTRLGWVRATLRVWRLGYGFHPRRYWGMRGVLFTCRFWDTRTRLCRVYPNRPAMCRDYAVCHPAKCQHGCQG